MNRIVYVKYSNEREKKFCIRTELREDESGNRTIIKLPMYKESVKHVMNMNDAYLKLSDKYKGQNITINKCLCTESAVEFEYIEGETLQEKVNECIKNSTLDEVYNILDYMVEIISYNTRDDFYYTDEFEHIFGNTEGLEGCKCSKVTNIDMILSNVIVNDTFNMIDYEWTFTFPIPYKYVVFRLCFFLIHQCNVNKKMSMDDLMYRYNISEHEYYVFGEMEKHFQKYISGNKKTLRQIGTQDTNNIRSINDINAIYIDNPDGLFVNIYELENYDRWKPLYKKNILLSRRCRENVRAVSNKLKIEVSCGCGLLLFNKLNFEIENNNGMEIAEGIYLYIADKMQFTIKNIEKINEFEIDFSIIKLEYESINNLKNAIDSLVKDNMSLRNEVYRLQSK